MSDSTSTSFNETSGTLRGGMLPAPEIDLSGYVADLEAEGLTAEQASEFLSTLVPLIWHFVDLGFRGDISELFVPCEESGAVDSMGNPKTEKPSKRKREEAAS